MTPAQLEVYSQIWMVQVSTHNVMGANQQQTYKNVAAWFNNNPVYATLI